MNFEDSEEEEKEGGGYGSRISSPSFLMIMEDGIRTYMNFLKADKERPCEIVASFFKRKKRAAVDPTLLQLMKKVNQKVSKSSKNMTSYNFKILINCYNYEFRRG